MTKSVRSVREDASVNEALELMSNAEIRRVPVVNGQNELVGILSLGDIAAQGNQDGKVGKAVEEISEAPPNN
jgi:CBS domain-containing protein